MNILVAAAWMWMAAQHSHIEGAVSWPQEAQTNCHGLELVCTSRLPVMQDAEPANPPPPTEHVIEIRTKQRKSGMVHACYDATAKCYEIKKPLYCPTGAHCWDSYEVVREIWIDGKKWGVLKESDQ